MLSKNPSCYCKVLQKDVAMKQSYAEIAETDVLRKEIASQYSAPI